MNLKVPCVGGAIEIIVEIYIIVDIIANFIDVYDHVPPYVEIVVDTLPI